GAARELVREPVVRDRVDQLVAGQDLVERALYRDGIARVTALRVGAESDLDLRPVVEQQVGGEVAERMTRPDGVLAETVAAGPEPDLHSTRRLPQRDRRLLALRQSGFELDG